MRYQALDMLRGGALVLMIVYHFCFDLNHFQLLSLDFYHDPFWLLARSVIVTLFLLLVGISLALSARRELGSKLFRLAFTRRLGWLLFCALLVSGVSYLQTPTRWIFFGILHFIVVASLLGLVFVARPRISLLLGLLLIAVGVFWSSPFFDQPALQWLGMMTHKPQTEDYVPLLPWFGVVLLGLAVAERWIREPAPVFLRRCYPGRLARLLSGAGRHSLLVYMLHQPLLFGMLALLTGTPLL